MKLGRCWLSLAYVLATLLAGVPHDHGRGADSSSFESDGSCDEARTHVAGHPFADRAGTPDACPICQFRGHHPFWVFAPATTPEAGTDAPPAISRPSNPPGAPLRATSRGPPRA